jgi:zinc transporter 1/2/3
MPSSLTYFKLLSAALTLAFGWVGVILPWMIERMAAAESILSLANMLSAGVMLGAGVLHLLPDAADNIGAVLGEGVEYPVGHLLFCAGLLAPLLVEGLLSNKGGRSPQRRGYQPGDAGDSDASSQSPLCCVPQPKTVAGMSGDPEERADGEVIGASMLDGHAHHGYTRELPVSSALVLLAALSFHSVLEGLAQGSATTLDSTMVLLVAILLHKGCGAFALGCVFLEARLARRTSLGLGLLFALATPLGTLAGMWLVPEEDAAQSGGALISSALVAMAGGSFTFVALVEVLPRELHAARRSVGDGAKLAVLSLGFAIMAILATVV